VITEHKLNIEVSREVNENCGAEIRKKECYDNIWKVINFGFGRNFIIGGWKIAYGYVSSINGLMARHCFIVDEEGNAIDPTLIQSEYFDEENPNVYISFATLTFEKYLDLIEKHGMNPSLFNVFLEEESEAKEYAMKHYGSFLYG
jgi:hypothetical protein